MYVNIKDATENEDLRFQEIYCISALKRWKHICQFSFAWENSQVFENFLSLSTV